MCPFSNMATEDGGKPESASNQDPGLRKKRCNETFLNSIQTILTKDKRYAICACGKVLLVYSIKTEKCLRKLKGHDGKIVNFYLRKKYPTQVLSADEGGSVFIWDYLQGTVVKTLKIKQSIKSMMQHPMDDDIIFISKKELNSKSEKHAVKHSLLKVELRLAEKEKAKKNLICTSLCSVASSSKKIAISYDGNVIGYLKKNMLKVYSSVDKEKRQFSLDGEKLLRITSHPSKLIFATGDSLGRIVLWSELFTAKSPITTVLHWHPHPLRSLSFSHDGLYLLSGGPEAVMVTWQLSSMQNDFLPRLGATITHITLSGDDTLVAVTLSNNKVKIFSLVEKLCICVLQGSAEVTNINAGIKHDPRTGCLVLPSFPPGHLQFYDAQEDSILTTVDITCQNYVVGPVGNAGYMSVVERFEFNYDGSWLVTIERGSYQLIPDEVKLKFWHYQLEDQRYDLITVADGPHESKITSLRVRPEAEVSRFNQMAVTTSADGKFKIWTFEVPDSNDMMGYNKMNSWKCQYSCTFGSWPCGKAAFSEDGSLLAVIYSKVITLWDSELGSLRTRFYCPVQDQRFSNVIFGAGTSAPYLLARTTHYLICWNLLSCSMCWSLDLQVTCLTVDPFSGYVAVSAMKSGSKSRVFLLDASTSKIAASLGKVPSKVRSMIFSSVDNVDVEISKRFCTIGRLCILTADKEIYSFDSVMKSDEVLETEEVTKEKVNNEFQSIFRSSLATKEAEGKEVEDVTKLPPGLPSAPFIRKVISTPSHVLPSVSSLCSALFNAVLSKSAESNIEQDEDADSLDHESESDEEDESRAVDNVKVQLPLEGDSLPKEPKWNSNLAHKRKNFDFNWLSEFVKSNYKS
ncbi:WD repeat-containing protein 75-like isoform X1 [Rhopilema esculentum]|uniref:WD repeat-containing protein 75-like isoform X1 n=1 Tax=Rhopilema esculentum TaxID=499914 RepID=UPI0031DB4617